jgi:hypothetical protein
LALAAFAPELSILLVGVGAVLVAIGIGYIVVSYGLLKGKGWAWSITLILSYIGIAIGIASIVTGNLLSIVHLIINIVIIWYLYRRHIKVLWKTSYGENLEIIRTDPKNINILSKDSPLFFCSKRLILAYRRIHIVIEDRCT